MQTNYDYKHSSFDLNPSAITFEPKLKISKGEFIKPESLKNEEFDCAKRKANFQNTSQNVDFDQF